MRTILLSAAMLAGAGALHAAIQSKTIEYQQGDATLEGVLVWDDAVAGPRPGVLVVHQWLGLTDYEQHRAKLLAQLGYAAFCADIYGKGIRPKTVAEAGAEATKYKSNRALLRARERRAGAIEKIRAGGSQAGRGHRLLLRRHRGHRTRAQRRELEWHRQFSRRSGFTRAGGRQEHQMPGARLPWRGRSI
jgi:hypothetical protein